MPRLAVLLLVVTLVSVGLYLTDVYVTPLAAFVEQNFVLVTLAAVAPLVWPWVE